MGRPTKLFSLLNLFNSLIIIQMLLWLIPVPYPLPHSWLAQHEPSCHQVSCVAMTACWVNSSSAVAERERSSPLIFTHSEPKGKTDLPALSALHPHSPGLPRDFNVQPALCKWPFQSLTVDQKSWDAHVLFGEKDWFWKGLELTLNSWRVES